MAGPEILVEPDVGDIGLRDFDRIEDAIAAGRAAAIAALPEIRRQMPGAARPSDGSGAELLVDPVCHMAISPISARTQLRRGDRIYYFCSDNCRESFERLPARYVRMDGVGPGRSFIRAARQGAEGQ
jgi:YHS domain-containing protein